jgi:hypothetical protein
MKDQVEMLAEERSRTHPATNAAQDVIASLPSQESRNALLDSVAKESEDPFPPGEGRTLQGVETVLTWVTYGLAVAVSVALAWSVGTSAMKYLMPQ